MNFSKLRVFYYFGLLLVTLLLCGLQSTVWFHWTGLSASPMLWLTIVVYLSLYRRFTAAILQIYLIAMVICFYSNIRLGILWLVLFFLHLGVSYSRDRIFSPNMRFFVFTTFGASFGFQILMIISSQFLEVSNVPISFFLRFSEVVLTSLASPITYFILQKLDHLTEQEEIWRVET